MEKQNIEYRNYIKLNSVISYYKKKVSDRLDAYKYSYTPRDIKARVRKINGGYKGSSSEYRTTVLAYWKRFGQKPKRIWYALYCDELNKYDPRYIPDPIWFHDILPYFNSKSFATAYADKSVYSFLFRDVNKPETIVKNMGGYYYDGDNDSIISEEEAVHLCEQEEHLIFKPSLGTKGAGILFYDRDDEKSMRIPDIFGKMSNNFVVQRIVKQHPDLARLNPSTLNTIRVISFHFKGEVYILSAQLRIGGSGSRVDNVSAGGSACAIYPNGWLHEKSVTRQSTWTDETATGIKLKTIHVPSYEKIVETIKKLHCKLPYFNIVGWDFAVREDGAPIMIEFNTRPGQNQIGGKEPTFGEMTEEVLEDVYIKKSLRNAFKK